MYANFKSIPTRTQYRMVLADTIEYFEKNEVVLSDSLKVHVLEQLNDIMKHLDDYESLGDVDDINERYDIGMIAINCLEDGSETQLRLSDALWGVINYLEMR